MSCLINDLRQDVHAAGKSGLQLIPPSEIAERCETKINTKRLSKPQRFVFFISNLAFPHFGQVGCHFGCCLQSQDVFCHFLGLREAPTADLPSGV